MHVSRVEMISEDSPSFHLNLCLDMVDPVSNMSVTVTQLLSRDVCVADEGLILPPSHEETRPSSPNVLLLDVSIVFESDSGGSAARRPSVRSRPPRWTRDES